MFNGSCENCGRDIIHEKSLKLGGTYWITTSGKWFCSSRCKNQFVSMTNANNQVPEINTDVINRVQASDNNENEAELQRLRLEREQEEQSQRMIKGQRFRDKGRPVAAWLTELNPVYSSCIILGILVSFIMDGVYPVIGSIALIVFSFLLIREAVKKS
ncbi:hypothetical protein ABIB62_002473 [Mucilaginibacter sp. UYP25]|uniref:hypothetical protein n=1 Tax=unclassified Mucilaginibacter TaxID=2617802 RepID=UPI003396A21F